MKKYIDLTRFKLRKEYKFYKPKINKRKLMMGCGLITACLITPATNWAIPLLFFGFIKQTPINLDNLKRKVKNKIKKRI